MTNNIITTSKKLTKAGEKIMRWCVAEKILLEDLLEKMAKVVQVDVKSLERYMYGTRVPRKPVAEAIYFYSEGYIEPNDFYDLEKIKNKPSKSKKR